MLIWLSYFININQSPYVNNISVCITAMKHEGKKKKKKKRHLHSRNSRTSRFTNFTSAILNRYWFLLKHFVYTHFYYICWNLCIILHNERETRSIQNTESRKKSFTPLVYFISSQQQEIIQDMIHSFHTLLSWRCDLEPFCIYHSCVAYAAL